MTQKVITKKSFIGGRMVYPGELVDVDAKGEVMPAASTPIGQMSIDQLRAALAAREATDKPEEFGKNVADPADNNTGTQALEMAPIRPGSGARPQVIPAGTVEHNDTFIRPAPEAAPAAVEEVVGFGGAAAFDRDGDGNAGGSLAHNPAALTGKNKEQLLAIAEDEGVEVPEGATNPEIRDAIEAKRADV